MEEKIQYVQLKCPKNNHAHLICQSSSCKKPGLICFDRKCQCQIDHKNCSFSRVDVMMTNLAESKMEISQESIKSFETIQGILDQMIQELSNIRDEVDQAKKYFGLRKNSRQILNKFMNHDFQNINGQLAQKAQKQLRGDKIVEQLNKQKIQIRWKAHQSHFDSMCKVLRGFFQAKKTKIFKGIVQNPSKITNQFGQLQQWIKPSFGNQIKEFKLLYRGSEQGFSADVFHKKCDSFNNVLVLIQTDTQKIIGGFNPNSFYQPPNKSYFTDNTLRTFIFSLTLKQKMFNTQGRPSIYSDNTLGPSFGGDILIVHQSDKFICTSGFPICYNNGVYKSSRKQSRMAFVGSRDGLFKTLQYEVYQVL